MKFMTKEDKYIIAGISGTQSILILLKLFKVLKVSWVIVLLPVIAVAVFTIIAICLLGRMFINLGKSHNRYEVNSNND